MVCYRTTVTNSLQFIGLSLMYTLIFLLLCAAPQASNDRTGKEELNFEYRVF
jgi:hypothetical protein